MATLNEEISKIWVETGGMYAYLGGYHLSKGGPPRTCEELAKDCDYEYEPQDCDEYDGFGIDNFEMRLVDCGETIE